MIKKISPFLRQRILRFQALSKRRRIIVATVVLVIVITIGYGSSALLFPRTPAPVPVATTTTTLTKGTPEYTTVLPKGKTIDTFGGWTRVSPPNRDPVYAYVDMIGKSRTIISQQELPESFRANPDGKTKELADLYNASTVLTVGSTTVYIGVSTTGTESVIFHVKDTLVLMKADTTIDQTDLKDYINTLV